MVEWSEQRWRWRRRCRCRRRFTIVNHCIALHCWSRFTITMVHVQLWSAARCSSPQHTVDKWILCRLWGMILYPEEPLLYNHNMLCCDCEDLAHLCCHNHRRQDFSATIVWWPSAIWIILSAFDQKVPTMQTWCCINLHFPWFLYCTSVTTLTEIGSIFSWQLLSAFSNVLYSSHGHTLHTLMSYCRLAQIGQNEGTAQQLSLTIVTATVLDTDWTQRLISQMMFKEKI